MYSEKVSSLLARKGIKIGDRIRLNARGSMFEGRLMPRPDAGSGDVIIIKLDNGYNVGIGMEGDAPVAIDKLQDSVITTSFSNASASRSAKNIAANSAKVELLYTGGTIGSKVDYVTGGVYMLTKPEELMYEVPELGSIASINVRHLMSVASEDISYREWQAIARNVADAFNCGARGVVITHGTDTMHYTSAALSFMLKDLKGPVVITGAQRSSDRGSSDGFMNLICSVHFAARGTIPEVGICMHGDTSDEYCNFIRGTKARKMHTSRRDAFRPVNSTPLARIGTDGSIAYSNDVTVQNNTKDIKDMKTTAKEAFEPKVALVKAHPDSDPDIIRYYSGKGYRGIIIEGTGLGHAPVSTPHKEYNWLENIKQAAGSGVVIGITSQCLYGRVDSSVYRNARLMADAGAVYCEDMLPEVAYVKLGFLLGNYGSEEAAKLLPVNIAGEITKRSEVDWFV